MAEAAGIAEGTVFRGFGTKDELVQACATAVFDTTTVVASLRGIDADLPLDDRLEAAVAVMQRWVERIIGVIGALHPAGGEPIKPRPRHNRRKPMSDPAVDAAFLDLVGPDVRRCASRRRTSSTSWLTSRSRAPTPCSPSGR